MRALKRFPLRPLTDLKKKKNNNNEKKKKKEEQERNESIYLMRRIRMATTMMTISISDMPSMQLALQSSV